MKAYLGRTIIDGYVTDVYNVDGYAEFVKISKVETEDKKDKKNANR